MSMVPLLLNVRLPFVSPKSWATVKVPRLSSWALRVRSPPAPAEAMSFERRLRTEAVHRSRVGSRGDAWAREGVERGGRVEWWRGGGRAPDGVRGPPPGTGPAPRVGSQSRAARQRTARASDVQPRP